MPPHQRDRIDESGLTLRIPGARTQGNRAFVPQQPGGERNPGEQSQQQWRGAGDGSVRPLALSLHSEVGAHLLEGDLDAPAQQKPLDDLKRIGPSIGADQCLRSHLAERISDQYPSDMHGRSSPAIPDCGLGCNLQCACRPVLPGHRYPGPGHIGVVQECDGRGQSLSLQAWPTYLPGQSGWSGLEERSIESESADEGDWLAQGLAAVQEFERRVSPVGHDDYAAVWQPAAQLDNHLACPVGDLLVWATHLLMVALCWSQCSQNRQCPGAMRPGDVCQPHQADPAQSACSDQMRLGGAHGVSKHSLGVDATAASSFQRLVDAEHQWLVILCEMLDEQHKQHTTQLQRRPDRSVEHVVILREAGIVAETHNA